MLVSHTEEIPDVMIIAPAVHGDHRGFFCETYRKDLFAEQGLDMEFVQDNHSRSSQGVLRGLHFQWEPPMGKLMRVTRGAAFLVAVDVRRGSATLGKWYGSEFTEDNKLQMWAPAGFARGFCVLSDFAEIQYKCTGTYNNECEDGICWNDPEVGIKWPIDDPVLSDRDSDAQTLSEWLKSEDSNNFVYGE